MGVFSYEDIGYAEIFIFDRFYIKQIREGAIIAKKETTRFKTIIKNHFKGKNMVYISNRTTSYSVNPLAYKEASKIKNLAGIAIIIANESMRAAVEYEKEFYDGPYAIFKNLSNAINWANTILKKSK